MIAMIWRATATPAGAVRPRPGQPAAQRQLLANARAGWAVRQRNGWRLALGHARLRGVNALLTGIIGVAATLLGPFSTYLFQGRAAKRAEAVARAERLHQEQLSASTAFAAAVTELKRGLVTLWFYKQTGQDGLIIRRPEWNAIAWGPTRKLPDSGCSLFPATLGS